MMALLSKLRCAAFGVEFGLAADSDDLLAAMRERAPWGTEIIAHPREGGMGFALERCGAGYRVTMSDSISQDLQLEDALDTFAHQLMLHVAEYAADCVFVHAGVVAWCGRALLLPGPSFAGKTTLVAELVRAGATYYSDEYALLDPRGLVHPYPRPLALRAPGSEKQTSTNVETFGGMVGVGPLRVSHVVFTQYAPGAGWSPHPVSSGMAALEMLRHAVPVQRTPPRVMQALARMMDGAEAAQSLRGEAPETARALLAMLRSEATA